MQIILRVSVPKLGELGDIVKVKDGYARNYLIPKGLATRATPGKIKALEVEKERRMHKIETERKQARELTDILETLTVKIKVKAGSEGRLFGSVTSMHVSNALKEVGYTFDKKHIQINDPIKEVGKYKVTVNLYEKISANVTILVEAIYP